MSICKFTTSAVALSIGLFVPHSQAAIINQTYAGLFPAQITGTLPDQGTALEETFTLAMPGTVTAYTTSYASGGFEPNLMLYTGAGKYITTGLTPGSSPVAMPDPNTKLALDAYLTAPNLPAGTYILTLTDFLLNQSLTATNLSDGFTVNYGSGTTFVDEMGDTRNGNFALTINAGAAAVPEPATIWLTMFSFAGVIFTAQRRRRQEKQFVKAVSL
jgi:hypothetical protein